MELEESREINRNGEREKTEITCPSRYQADGKPERSKVRQGVMGEKAGLLTMLRSWGVGLRVVPGPGSLGACSGLLCWSLTLV